MRRIDEWLAEGIDIDNDGQFTERSTLVYNIITNRALIVMAAKLRRPELLEPVRRNLHALQYLLHADGEVVSEISRRQDQFTRGTVTGYWFPLTYMAVTDRNGQFATLASRAAPDGARLSALLEYPELSQPLPPSSRAARQLRHGVQRHRHRAYSPGSAQRDAGARRLQPVLHAALRQRRDGGPPLRDIVFW